MRVGTVTTTSPVRVRETSRSRLTDHEVDEVADGITPTVGQRVLFELVERRVYVVAAYS